MQWRMHARRGLSHELTCASKARHHDTGTTCKLSANELPTHLTYATKFVQAHISKAACTIQFEPPGSLFRPQLQALALHVSELQSLCTRALIHQMTWRWTQPVAPQCKAAALSKHGMHLAQVRVRPASSKQADMHASERASKPAHTHQHKCPGTTASQVPQ